MAECRIQDWKHTSAPESVSRHEASIPRTRQRNIFGLLAQRELSPRTKNQAKNLWTKPPRRDACPVELKFWGTDARHDLLSWAESEFLRWWIPKYCPLLPSSKATIAAAFSPDGRVLASTHGDHTVKIIDCQTGKCLNVLFGHQRTPWVVRFHPLHSDILASGSLDCEVRLWDAKTSRCTAVLPFYRPIASIAFHATGELLAVASGHKLFIWDCNNRFETLEPPIILKTRRSLRAVQFHPHGAPYLLTAEVHNLDSEDSTMTPALLSNYSFRDTPLLGSGVDNLISELSYMHNFEQVDASSSVPVTTGSFDGSRLHDTTGHHLMTSVPGIGSSLLGTHTAEAEAPAISLSVGAEQSTSLLGGGTELPCTVKLRIWRHNMKNPFIALGPEACLLTIPHAVLCSEMGTHFSPCGRFLVACVACVLPHRDGDHGSQLHEHYDSTGAGTSPTRHTLPSRIKEELEHHSMRGRGEDHYSPKTSSVSISAYNSSNSSPAKPRNSFDGGSSSSVSVGKSVRTFRAREPAAFQDQSQELPDDAGDGRYALDVHGSEEPYGYRAYQSIPRFQYERSGSDPILGGVAVSSDETESSDDDDDDVGGAGYSTRESTPEVDENEVDKKAEEFIARFREQIRRQRIESIKKSAGPRGVKHHGK